jgi:predicted membrane-bound mannosyltransferase
MRHPALLLALCLAQTGLQAQGQETEREAVLRLTERFLTALNARDTATLAGLMAPGAQFFLVERGATERLVAIGRAQYLQDIGRYPHQRIMERAWHHEVLLRDGLATVFAEYDFHLNEAFSHCGTDVFDLARVNGVWTITGGQFTMRVERCTESPLGPAFPVKPIRPER